MFHEYLNTGCFNKNRKSGLILYMHVCINTCAERLLWVGVYMHIVIHVPTSRLRKGTHGYANRQPCAVIDVYASAHRHAIVGGCTDSAMESCKFSCVYTYDEIWGPFCSTYTYARITLHARRSETNCVIDGEIDSEIGTEINSEIVSNG